MKTVAMIPIKFNNERLPGKNIKTFYDGTPLISLIQRACVNAREIDEVYVYCSTDRVIDYLEPGVKYLNRPRWLDTPAVNCNDIIREFMKEVEADIYIASHATGPFTRSESIDKCISMVKSGKYDSGFLGQKIQQFFWQNGRPLNFDIQHFPRTQDLVPIYCETPGAYVFTKETFQKYDRRVGVHPYICEVSEIEARDIDNADELAIADMIYQTMKFSGR